MRKKLSVIAAVMATLMVAAVAYAYWTAGGTGSGNATVGTDSGVSITAVAYADNASDTDSSANLYPGSNSDVTFTINNLSANTPVKVGKVVANTVNDQGTPDPTDDTEWVNGISTSAAGCLPSWFTYSGSATLDQQINASSSYNVVAGSGGTLAMSNESLVQDACKNATVTLHLKVDNNAID